MAKRFTDTAKWNNQWLRGLKTPYKLLWLYMLDECDHAGIWQIDIDVAQVKTGETLSLQEALKQFEGRAFLIDGGDRLFIRDFVDFQYGELNPSNRVHASAIQILRKFSLWNEMECDIKPLFSPLYEAKDTVKDTVTEKVKEKASRNPKIVQVIVMPFDSPDFKVAWEKWLMYRKQIGKPYKSEMSQQAQLKTLSNYSEDVAIRSILKSIESGWQGIFPDKIENNGTSKTRSGASTSEIVEGFKQRANNGANGGQSTRFF